MAQPQLNHSMLTLRAVTYRISSTPAKQLPHIVQQLSGSLWNCKDLLSTPQRTSKPNSESSTLVHRFRTSISSLLQDRTGEGRWAGIVLAKATLEAGGLETLNTCGTWVKNLLTILKRPDPPTTRMLAMITLTRIFTLTWEHTSLVREITTPNLPAFVATCLSNTENSRCSAAEFQTILEAFVVLLPRHPTILRSHEGSIRDLVFRAIDSKMSETTANIHYTETHKSIARRLLALLPHCAPKQGAAEKWREAIQNDLAAAHPICDVLFRSIIEDSPSNHAPRQPTDPNSPYAKYIANGKLEYSETHPTERVFAHAEILINLLAILQKHVETTTASPVAVPIGQVVDLISRLFSIVSGDSASVKANPQIPKDERDLMFSLLPEIHVAALKLLVSIIDRFGASLVSILQSLVERATEVWVAERADMNLRKATYEMLRTVLELMGPSMSKEDVTELVPIAKSCCNDLMPHDSNTAPPQSAAGSAATSKHQIQVPELNTPNMDHQIQTQDLHSAARALLVVLITKIDSASMPRKLRVQMERIAILSKDHEALVACVLNPAKNASGTAAQTSLLPLLAKLFPESSEVEALLRPRMPVLSSHQRAVRSNGEVFDGEDESVGDGASEVGEENMMEHAATLNQSEEVSSLLQQDAVADNEANGDELYTASPRLLPHIDTKLQESQLDQNGLNNHDSSTKRPAFEPPDNHFPAKRLRSSPVVDPAVPESAAPAPPEVLVHSAEIVPVEMPQAQEGPLHQGEVNAGVSPDLANDAQAVSYRAASNLLDNAMDSDSGSDVEVPPLTMESDSEPAEDDET